MMFFSLLFSLWLCSPAAAQTRTIQEGVPASGQTILVSTSTRRVLISTKTYQGGIANVGLFTSSNVVVSSTGATNNIVLYATGSITVNGVVLGAVGATGSTGPTAATGATGATGAAGSAGVHNSSSSIVLAGAYTTTDTSFKTCIATNTIVTTGGAVAVWFAGATQNSNAGQGCMLSFMVDGGWIAPLTAAYGIAVGISNSGGAPAGASFYYTIPAGTGSALSAASHAFCLTLAAWAYTCSLGTAQYNQFGVMEVK